MWSPKKLKPQNDTYQKSKFIPATSDAEDDPEGNKYVPKSAYNVRDFKLTSKPGMNLRPYEKPLAQCSARL